MKDRSGEAGTRPNIPLADIADFCERVNNIDPMCGFGYSPASMALSNRKRIAPSLLLREITKHTRPWLEVSA